MALASHQGTESSIPGRKGSAPVYAEHDCALLRLQSECGLEQDYLADFQETMRLTVGRMKDGYLHYHV